MGKPRSKFGAGFALVCIVGSIFLTVSILTQDGPLYMENGPLENVQILLLFVSGIAFLLPVSNAPRCFKCVLLGGALLSLSFICRELNMDTFNVPAWVVSVGNGVGRNVILGLSWVALGVFAIKSFATFKENFREILLSRTTLLLVIAGALLLSGSLFDQKDNKTTADQMAEEVVEVVGYAIYFLAALASRFTARSLLAKEGETQKHIERIISSERVLKDVAENHADVPVDVEGTETVPLII